MCHYLIKESRKNLQDYSKSQGKNGWSFSKSQRIFLNFCDNPELCCYLPLYCDCYFLFSSISWQNALFSSMSVLSFDSFLSFELASWRNNNGQNNEVEHPQESLHNFYKYIFFGQIHTHVFDMLVKECTYNVDIFDTLQIKSYIFNLDLPRKTHADFCSFSLSLEFLVMFALLWEATVVLPGEEL